ncbi:MAG: Ig-like domain-containing protein, partial [Serpentinimonas sp.]|nr:Ig-like domain-containing protein [Serpentinimonas sp.]
MNMLLHGVRPWLAAILLGALVAGCGGGGRDEILGFDATPPAPPPPTVTAVAPPNGATGVPLNITQISADFSERMAPLTGTASFVVTCAAPCTSPVGTTTLDATGRIATFALPAGTLLDPLTQYTGTITAARSATTGLAMAEPFVWRFTTGVTPDTTRPRVTLTVPATTVPGPTTGVPTNTAVTATFTEDMAPASISATSFTLACTAPCVAPLGNVTYVVGNRTAVFTPAAALAAGTTYTATVTTAATDLAGNALGGNQAPLPAASNYVWTFTTAAAVPPAPISVESTNPADGAANVCLTDAINATFTVPSGLRMDPTTINAANFTLTGPGGANVLPASVVLDVATGRIATFTPLAPMLAGVHVARLRGTAAGVLDLAVPGNSMASDFSWSFTAVSCVVPPVPPLVPLGSAATFGIFGGSAGMTNQGTLTIVNGDIGTTGVSTLVTGFHSPGPGCIYTQTPLDVGRVNGGIFTAPPPPTVACPDEGTAVTLAVAQQARADALIAYNQLVAMPPGSDPGAGSLSGLTLAPGVYTAALGSFMIQGSDLTLDGQGNANAT